MKITILGCGVYGMALGNSFLVNQNNRVTMWSKFDKEVKELRDKYPNIQFDTDLEKVTMGSDLIVIAIPVAFLDSVVDELKKCYQGQDILIASKGIETVKQRFAYEIILEKLDNAPIGVISGGTFAVDMMKEKVMGLTLASKEQRIIDKVHLSLASRFLKIQVTDDVVGVSVCGALKNIMAIGFGILDGAGYPESSRFLFLTEAIYEIQHLIEALGGNLETIMSYAGIDDIMMTCTSSKSRNYTLGRMLGNGLSSEEINEYKTNTTIEGLGSSEAIYYLAKRSGITLGLSEIIYEILYKDRSVIDLIHYLEEKES